MFKKVITGDYSFNDKVAQVSSEAKDLIRRLLDVDPCSRFSIKQAMAHPFLADGNSLSYQANFGKFLLDQNIVLKPKIEEHVDQYLLGQLEQLKS